MYARTLMGGSGISAGAATAITGGVGTHVPAGTTNADATAMGRLGIAFLAAVSSGTGVRLASGGPGDSITVANQDATNAVLVYPPVVIGGAASQINNLTATTGGFSVAANKRCTFYCVSATQWVSVLSA